MNDKVVKENASFKITYDGKKNDVKAKIEYSSTDEFGNKKRTSYYCEGLTEVNRLLKEYMNHTSLDLRGLVINNKIKLEGEAAIRYDFDYINNSIVEKRLRRSDRMHLEGREYDDTPYKENVVKESETKEVKEETPKGETSEKNEEKSSKETIVDKAKDVVTEASKKTKEVVKEKKEKIKNLKVFNWKHLRNIVITGLVVAGVTYLAVPKGGTYNNNNNNNNNDDNDYDRNHYSTYDDGSVPTTFNTSEDVVSATSMPAYMDSSPVYDENIEARMNDLAGICYQNISDMYNFVNGGTLTEYANPCNLENLVSNSDRDAIRVISDSRNYVVNNAYNDRNVILTKTDVYRFLMDYVNYAFEGGTVFDGQAIKAFDYLDPYSQYIVTVVGESMLQLYPGYNYESAYVNYSYEELVQKMMDKHDELSNQLVNGYGRRY